MHRTQGGHSECGYLIVRLWRIADSAILCPASGGRLPDVRCGLVDAVRFREPWVSSWVQWFMVPKLRGGLIHACEGDQNQNQNQNQSLYHGGTEVHGEDRGGAFYW